MKVKKPGFCVQDWKKQLQRTTNDIERRPTQSLKPLRHQIGRSGGQKGGVFSEPEVTLKMATANFTKKS